MKRIRVSLLTLLALVLGADVWAQSPIRVGYYDMVVGSGSPEQAAPILTAGFTPVPLSGVTATDLVHLDILFVQNPSPTGYPTTYLSNMPAIQAAVNAGLVLVIHDRTVGPPPAGTGAGRILPGASSIFGSKSSTTAANNIQVSDPDTLVASGPFGTITHLNLDGGNPSNSGWVRLLPSFGVPPGAKALLQTVSPPEQLPAVAFSYPFGAGYVVYSTVPLDVFLKDMGTAAPAVRATFREVYAPNVLTYAACGLKAMPATVAVAPASATYGGTTTLEAALRCGVLPLSGATVDFSLDGVPIGSAVTDTTGTAWITNLDLGSIAGVTARVGTHTIGATFDGTSQYGASAGTGTLTVGPAPLLIVADDKERLVGQQNPELTVSYQGFVAGESATHLTTPPSITTTATPASAAGHYPIVVSGAEAENYAIEYVNGTLTISPEGQMRGQGFVDAPGARHHFLFDIHDTIVSGKAARLTVRVVRDDASDAVFASRAVTSVTFSQSTASARGRAVQADTVVFAGVGTWNGTAATFEASAIDVAEPGVGRDIVMLTIRVDGVIVSSVNGSLSGGNVQSNRLSGR